MAMDSNQTRALTSLLDGLNGGGGEAFARLVDAVYNDLKKIASKRMSHRFNQPLDSLTMQPTAIANDAVMELRRQRAAFQNSEHFFAIATRLIERLIRDYRARRNAEKRGGGKRAASLDERIPLPVIDALHIDDSEPPILRALQQLHEEYPRKAEVVSLHVICGHPLSKIAQMLDLSPAQIQRDWSFAQTWLKSAMREGRQ
jgi:RNA polymerase sigma factor (TIGR02999 family)